MADRRVFALPPEIRLGDRVLLVDNPEDGLRWVPGIETSYYQVTSQPERKVLDVELQGGKVPRHTWWMTATRPATEDDPSVWSDGRVVDGTLIRMAFFLEDHTAAVKRGA